MVESEIFKSSLKEGGGIVSVKNCQVMSFSLHWFRMVVFVSQESFMVSIGMASLSISWGMGPYDREFNRMKA